MYPVISRLFNMQVKYAVLPDSLPEATEVIKAATDYMAENKAVRVRVRTRASR